MSCRHTSFHRGSDSWFWFQTHCFCLDSFAFLKSIICRDLLLLFPILLLLLFNLIYDYMAWAGTSESEKGRVCLVEKISFGEAFSDCDCRLIQLLRLGRRRLLLLLLLRLSWHFIPVFLRVYSIICFLVLWLWLHNYFIFHLNLINALIVTPFWCLLLRWVPPDRLNCTRNSGFGQSLLCSIRMYLTRLEFTCSLKRVGIQVTLSLVLASVIIVLWGS